MQRDLARVKRATEWRAAADAEWRASLVAARAAGCSLREISSVAGVTNPRIHQLTKVRVDAHR